MCDPTIFYIAEFHSFKCCWCWRAVNMNSKTSKSYQKSYTVIQNGIYETIRRIGEYFVTNISTREELKNDRKTFVKLRVLVQFSVPPVFNSSAYHDELFTEYSQSVTTVTDIFKRPLSENMSHIIWLCINAWYINIKDPNKSNTQKYFRHSYVKRYELALLRFGYFIYFCRL